MQKEIVVLSLGGSLIIPEDVDINFLRKFRDVLKRNSGRDNKLRDYGIYIDDKKIGTIENGETFSYFQKG